MVASTSDGTQLIIIGLGSSGLTGLVAFGIEAWRLRRRVSDVRDDKLIEACAKMISSAQKIIFKAAALHMTMQIRSGLRESLDVLLHQRKPIDVLELNDYLLVEQGVILDAQAVMWLLGDEALHKSGGDIVAAVQELIVASTALPPSRQMNPSDDVIGKVTTALRGLTPLEHGPELEAKIDESARKLGRSCAALVPVMRKSLKVKDVDALFRAHPGLLPVDSDAGPAEEPGTSNGG